MSDLPKNSEEPISTSQSLFKKKKKKTMTTASEQQNQSRKRVTIDSEEISNQLMEDQKEDSSKRLKLTNQDDHQDLSNQAPIVKFNRRKNRNGFNPLCQATSTKRLKHGHGLSSSSDDDDDDDDDDDINDSEDGRSKKRNKNLNSIGVSYKAKGSAREQAEESKLRSLEEIKETKKNPFEEGSSLLRIEEEDRLGIEGADDKNIYLGNSKSKYQLPKGSLKYGPIKGGPNNIQTITVVDYQPDVCKDYKETGYCGFGDTCKFLHDRGDYMHGWQLDDAFNSSRNKKMEEESEEEEEVPFACLICRQPFTDPIVTKCQHYYCSNCAIKRFAKTPKCFACGAPTGGIFNKATRIIEKMKLKQERIRKEKEEKRLEQEGLSGIEGLAEVEGEGGLGADGQQEGSERSFYEDE